MPGCVPECRNHSEGDYRLFRVPTAQNDELRRKVWLDYINRRELPIRALICEMMSQGIWKVKHLRVLK
ncbi:hypothetical protein FQA39_LY00858 [Lamprigera yunnana]|nr:hypothetical protein FQA39_LY00858 [Lamprigera yunnana]